MRLKQLLGEIMIGMGFVTRKQVDDALQRQRKIFTSFIRSCRHPRTEYLMFSNKHLATAQIAGNPEYARLVSGSRKTKRNLKIPRRRQSAAKPLNWGTSRGQRSSPYL